MDGVLADFDRGAQRMLGTDNTYKYEWVFGTEAFWYGINLDPEFFLTLPMMPDVALLLNAVWHKRPDLKVLTALPKTNAERVRQQKLSWLATNVGEIEVITCLTHEKPSYCQPGDVLVDDRNIQAEPWTNKGGVFILHVDAKTTVKQMVELGVI